MLRKGTIAALLALVGGCATLGGAPPPKGEGPRLEDLARSQARLEMRVDEVTRNLLALRERLEAQDAALGALRETAREPREEGAEESTTPALPVIKVEPLPPPARPPAASPAPASPTAGLPAPRPATENDPKGASDLYRRAFSGFREARYGQAILDFEEFLRRYPGHEYADNAQYWLGECYYSQNEYEEAIVEFGRVLDRHPGGSKMPDALLKLGLSYDKLRDSQKARVFWKRLVNEYPDSEAAVQARTLLGG